MRLRFYHYILIFFIFNFLPQNIQSTVIVIIKLGNTIYIGADSQSSTEKGEFRNTFACKIIQISDIYFAYSGIAHSLNPYFSAPQIAIDSFTIDSTFEIRNSIFEDQFSIKFKNLANTIDDSMRETKKMICIDHIRQTAIIIKPQNPFPILYQFDFFVSDKTDSGYIVTSGLIETFPDTFIFPLGEHTIINKELREKGGVKYFGIDPIKAIIDLISLEAASSKYVSLPVDILKITRDKAEWIQRKNNCTNNDWQ
jgi:hypothetical protein